MTEMDSSHEVLYVLDRFGKPFMKTGHYRKPSRCHELRVLDKFGKPIMKKGHYKFLHVTKAYNPQSLVDWYNVGVEDDDYDFNYMIDLWNKAIRHLSAIGWVFRCTFNVVKTTKSSNTKTEYLYHSPNGNTYDSLRSACKVCLSETERTDDSLESAFNNSFCTSGTTTTTTTTTRKRNRCGGGDDLVVELNNLKLEGCISDPKRKKRNSHSHDDDDDDMVADFDDEPVVHRKPPARVLCWLIEKKVVVSSAKVSYYCGSTNNILGSGEITRRGIKCNCCSKFFTLSTFEKHVGAITTTFHEDYDEGQCSNFILEDGRSLMHCIKVTLKENKINTLRYDSIIYDNKCSVCHCDRDEEEVLIMCDWCPSTFHPTCVGLNKVPDQNHNYYWICPSCSCGICGNGHNHGLVFCHHCPTKYHTSCITKDGKKKLNKFCSKGCVQVYWGLRNIRQGKPIPVASGDSNLTWTLLKLTGSETTDIFRKAENYKNLKRALDVMRECFDHNQKQRIVIEDVIMDGALKFKGFYTAVLKRGDELITVATVRIHGDKLAEIPLIATRLQHRRLGRCRALMNALEKQLSDLGVERLTMPLPAIPSDLHTCFSSLGLSKMTLYERSRLLKYTLLDLPDTVMWHKFLKDSSSSSSPSNDNFKS